MKHITLLATAALISASIQGQVFTSGLEDWNNDLPADFMGSRTNIPVANVSQVSEDPHDGTYAVRLVNTSTVNNEHRRLTTQPVPVVSGTVYTVNFWARGEGRVRVGLYDGRSQSAGFAPYNPTAFVTVTGNVWTEHSLTVTCTHDTTGGEFILSVLATQEPEHLVIDDVNITAGDVVPPTAASIYEIQFVASGDGPSTYVGQTVITGGIVTGVDTIGADSYFIQSGQGPWTGLSVFDPANAVTIGDSVALTGVVSEFQNRTELGTISSFTNHGQHEVPTPEPLTPSEAQAEQWEGVLVNIADVEATSGPNQFNEWIATSFQGSVIVDDVMYFYTPTLGNFYTITGIMDQRLTDRKICPRQLSDIGVGSSIGELSGSTVSVFPNPAASLVTIDLGGLAGRTEYNLRDASGRLVGTDVIMSDRATIDVTNLANGLYVITLVNNGASMATRIAVQH